MAIIKQLQDNRHKVIALTARSSDPLKSCTIEHLKQVDIDFTRTSIYPQDIILAHVHITLMALFLLMENIKVMFCVLYLLRLVMRQKRLFLLMIRNIITTL